ncbi:MAG: phospholipase [Deltaproteobacteria bacterium]|nr:phospholipase [Deltaproteobacteria bacterium]
MTRTARLAAPLLLTALLAPRARAWDDHAIVTRESLASLPALGARVRAEPLEAFLAAEGARLEALLAGEEPWLREHVPAWPPLPAALAFRAAGPAGELRARFLAALRVHPAMPLPLFRQLAPGAPLPPGAAALPPSAVTLVRSGPDAATFVALADGEEVPALEVVATAADEPDHGLDLGIWEDNGTAWGARYGLGPQPFGNPALEFSSQAPMHMGFFHEPWLAYRAAPQLRRTFPEVRIHLFRALAAHAFATGHAYWGWRFTGFALHYLQDLAQPYHARAVPGVGLARVAWLQLLGAVGFPGPRAAAIALASNRHLAAESYTRRRLRDAIAASRAGDPLLAALRETSGDGTAPLADADVRAGVARAGHAAADPLDEAVLRTFPARHVADPAYTFDDTREPVDLPALARAGDPAAEQALVRLLSTRLRDAGRWSRALVRGLPPGR